MASQTIRPRSSARPAHFQPGCSRYGAGLPVAGLVRCTSRDDSAEAAFEELMIRHGPMVFGICKNVLQDVHDAQDAFQAVFLVLANRARSIRRKDSVASWLFGVAKRVSARARSRAARRRAIDKKAAEQASECYILPEHDADREIVHEELDRLPERLRAPIVLCYLEGLSYDAAAHQLELSEGMLRGRFSQAKKRCAAGSLVEASNPLACSPPGHQPSCMPPFPKSSSARPSRSHMD